MILLMSVIPGKCGQTYDTSINQKLKTLAYKLITRNPNTIIQIDGGIKTTNAKEIINIVKDYNLNLLLVSGSGVYGQKKPDYAVKEILNI
jgi:ribulose-phosphate 3-epimerase